MSSEKFNKPRTGTGTREWSEKSCNIGHGCANDCIYCYARWDNEVRYRQIAPGDWKYEKIRWDKVHRQERPVKGVVMFPSQHDITAAYLEPALIKITQHLQMGNKLLIVTKPSWPVFNEIMEHIEHLGKDAKDNVMFRISMTGTDPLTAIFWEPSAPAPEERLYCLKEAFDRGFKTSVSAEPILPTYTTLAMAGRDIYSACAQYTTDSVWFGLLNKPGLRIRGINKDLLARINEYQKPERVLDLVRHFRPEHLHPKVRWKDSIQAIIDKALELGTLPPSAPPPAARGNDNAG